MQSYPSGIQKNWTRTSAKGHTDWNIWKYLCHLYHFHSNSGQSMKLSLYSGNSSMTPMRVKKKKWKFRGTPLLPLLISQFNRQTVIRLYPFVYTTLYSRTSGQKTVRIICLEASRMCVARHHHLITNSELQPPCVVIWVMLHSPELVEFIQL